MIPEIPALILIRKDEITQDFIQLADKHIDETCCKAASSISFMQKTLLHCSSFIRGI